MDRLLAEVPSGVERADVLLELAYTSYSGDPRPSSSSATAPSSRRRETRRDSRASGRIDPLFTSGRRMRSRTWPMPGGRLTSPTRSETRVSIAVSIARVRLGESYAGQPTPGLLERGVELEVRHHLASEYFESPRYAQARVLMRLGQLDEARRALMDLEAETSARGDEGSRGITLWAQSMLEWLSGDWPRARQLSDAAYDLSKEIEHAHGLNWVGTCESSARGRPRTVRTGAGVGRRGARLRSAVGQRPVHGHGARHARPARTRPGPPRGSRRIPARSSATTARRRNLRPDHPPVAGRDRDAHRGRRARPGSRVSRHAPRTRRSTEQPMGAVDLRPLPRTPPRQRRRRRGSHRGDIESALAVLEGVDYPFERARALLVLGVLRRQTQQKTHARDSDERSARHLRATRRPAVGRQCTHRTRADQWSPACPVGARRNRASSREPWRPRDARNKEIAADMRLGVSTVEAHLWSVYRKLGCKRAELGARLRDDSAEG